MVEVIALKLRQMAALVVVLVLVALPDQELLIKATRVVMIILDLVLMDLVLGAVLER